MSKKECIKSYDTLNAPKCTRAVYTTHPIYFQNYILAEMIAAQTIQHLKEKYVRLLHSAKIAEFLIQNYYGPGSNVDWPEKIEKATGRRLSAEVLVQQLAVNR